MQAIGRANKMQGFTGEEPLVKRAWCDTGHGNRIAALTERDQALHHRVEVVLGEIVEEHTHFGWWLLELKTISVDRLNGDRYQCKRIWTSGAAQVHDHHLAGLQGAGAAA